MWTKIFFAQYLACIYFTNLLVVAAVQQLNAILEKNNNKFINP